MVSSSLYAPLAALITYVTTVSAAPSVSPAPRLTARTSIPNVDVDGVKNLKVITTVVNTGGETLKPLNDPRGVLDPFAENTFTITNSAGSSSSSNGAKATYTPINAGGLDGPSAFTVIAPGDSTDVTHDFSTVYDSIQSGTGNHTVELSNLSTYVDVDGTPKDLYTTIEDAAKVGLSGNLAVTRNVQDLSDLFVGCDPSDASDLTDAIEQAQRAIDEAYEYLRLARGPMPRYTTWFGKYTRKRKAKIEAVFQRMSQDHPLTRRVFDCRCEGYPDDYIATAVIWPIEFIRICPRFWRETTTLQEGTLIHEATHFRSTGSTTDKGYGRGACKQLVRTRPQVARKNADNYLFFALNLEGLR